MERGGVSGGVVQYRNKKCDKRRKKAENVAHPSEEALHVPLEGVRAGFDVLFPEVFPDFVEVGTEDAVVVFEVPR